MARILSAFVLAVPVLAVVEFAPLGVLVALVSVVALRGGWELSGLFRDIGWSGARWEIPLDAGALAVLVGLRSEATGLALAVIVLRLLVRALGAEEAREGFAAAGVSLVGALWVGGSAGFLAATGGLPGGREGVVFLLALVWVGDTAAYYVGRRFGRRPLAPAISPRKTVEGAVAGLFGSAAVGVAWGTCWGGSAAGPALAGAVAAVLGGLSQVGDLVESRVKRAAGAKDASSLIPGHGGMLDRVDGLLLAAPPFYYLVKWFLAP